MGKMGQNLREIAKEHEWHNVRWFRRMAPVYELVEVFARHIREKVVSDSGLSPGAKVLDMACGTGAQSIAFAKHGFSVVGVDLSPDMLARAKRKVGNDDDVTFLCLDASRVPFADSEFDLATISFGLHDMPEEIGVAVLKEMRRVTKPAGKIVIVDYDVPQNSFSSFFGHAFAKIWESKYYDHFLEAGLQHYLDEARLSAEEKEKFMLGNIQKKVCNNHWNEFILSLSIAEIQKQRSSHAGKYHFHVERRDHKPGRHSGRRAGLYVRFEQTGFDRGDDRVRRGYPRSSEDTEAGEAGR